MSKSTYSKTEEVKKETTQPAEPPLVGEQKTETVTTTVTETVKEEKEEDTSEKSE